MTCGECAAAITADGKQQVICATCKRKFSSLNRLDCPRCGTSCADTRTHKHLAYEYYRCTKRKGPCSQRSLEVAGLEEQIAGILGSLTIPEPFKNWWLKQLKLQAEQDADDKTPLLESLQEARKRCQQQLQNLLSLKIAAGNSDGSMLTDEEFAARRAALTAEDERLQRQLAAVQNDSGQWWDTCVRVFDFASYARDHFQKGSSKARRAIVCALGSNLALEDQNLRISLHKHFQLMQNVHMGLAAENGTFEPSDFRQPQRKNRASNPVLPTWLPDWDVIRTCFTVETATIPVLPN